MTYNISNFIMNCYLLLLLLGCEQPSQTTAQYWQTIACRDSGIPSFRSPLYRALVPTHWTRLDPSAEDSILDTTKPICTFVIDPDLQITLHTFAVDQIEQRIPPQAQIMRWKKQFDDFDDTPIIVNEISKGGFTGLFLRASGEINGKAVAILGYSMQLAPLYWRTLHYKKETSFLEHQMSSDYTIKAVGPPSTILKYQAEIEKFALSFELIQELPLRS